MLSLHLCCSLATGLATTILRIFLVSALKLHVSLVTSYIKLLYVHCDELYKSRSSPLLLHPTPVTTQKE